ncbi:MAG: DUF6880 family protein [Actinomycetota bacterium]
MKNRNSQDFVKQIEDALELDTFIPYSRVWVFVKNLQKVEDKIYTLIENGQAEQAVYLYEIFLAGCYGKADEIDDSSGDLGMFFEQLFCGWIEARQEANYDPKQTVNQVLKWMENDDYGFCYDIEKSVVEVFGSNELEIFESIIKSRFDEAYGSTKGKEVIEAYHFPHPVRKNSEILKIIYREKNDTSSYLSLCEKIGITPEDCEQIALLHKSNNYFQEALSWVDKGLQLEQKRNWQYGSSFCLERLKRQLSSLLGNNDYAIKSAWAEYKKYPSVYSYDELMEYVGKKDSGFWHKKAIEVAKKAPLDSAIEILVQKKELGILCQRILTAKDEELEDISHYKTEEAAKALCHKNALAAAKVYCALGMRILKAGKSKYYDVALEHFLKVKTIYIKNNAKQKWSSVVSGIREKHGRKYSFMPFFEELVSGKYPPVKQTFAQMAKKKWDKQTGSQ